MSRLFGTDGVRGKANLEPMDSETVLRLGRAIAHVMRRSSTERHRILIGKDTRVSGYMLETALATGITSMGVDVLLVGPLPTPGVAFMTRSMRADAGVMISASHNPYEDNGIKFFGPDGFKLPDETEDEIERLMQPGHLDELRAVPELIGKAARIDDAVGRYTVYLKSCVEREAKLDGLKLAVDCANGAAYRIAPLVFQELGATIYTDGVTPDGKNINLDCGSLHPERVERLVVENGADCGIAFDGDADRVIFVDDKGQTLNGDTVLAIIATEFKKMGLLKSDAIVGTVMSNLGLEDALEKAGISLIRSAVGDRYVLAEMKKNDINFGGEQSGHVIALDYNTTGDGILTALLILSILVKQGKKLSDYQSIVEFYPQELINVKVREKVPFSNNKKISKALEDIEAKLGATGRVLLRYSGTEQKARVMVECKDAKLCISSAEAVAEAIREELGA